MRSVLLQALTRTAITNACAEAYAILIHYMAPIHALAAASYKETRMRSNFVVDPSDGWWAMYIKHSNCPLLCCCACAALLSSALSSAITQSQNALIVHLLPLICTCVTIGMAASLHAFSRAALSSSGT
jgi:hypothetical protein